MIEQHTSDRYCKGCKAWKPVQAFTLRSDRISPQRRSHCTRCMSAIRKAYKVAQRARTESFAPAPIPLSAREVLARKLCSELQTYWHIAETNPRFGEPVVRGGVL